MKLRIRGAMVSLGIAASCRIRPGPVKPRRPTLRDPGAVRPRDVARFEVDGSAGVKRILVPTDFSDPSAEALATAVTLARQAGATVDLVHVAVEASFALPPPIDVATVPIDMSKVMERVADGLAAEEKRVSEAGLRCETAMLVGRPDAGDRRPRAARRTRS